MNRALFNTVSVTCSKLTTRAYSTSFSIGIRCLKKKLQGPVYSIYGFVRFADEIVDTFHEHDKAALLQRFREDTYRALEDRISLNPILNSYQATANQYNFEKELTDQFLKSMEMDLHLKSYDQKEIKEYILGSAEVVGLMCLRVFCEGDEAAYQKLKPLAMKLGSAFQKVNFLRDLNADFNSMGRTYFPGIDLTRFDETSKSRIEEDIAADFREAYIGIKLLPRNARFGVYVAYLYYLALFKKIKNTPSHMVLQNRISVRNRHKLSILAYSFVKHQLNMI
ncbi:MAG: phytoene/squalene synthase family protein [Cyclobacteriaceae bacterium]|nr:phytoene/squalene synthase family protein [Cyclobacteriaceae bacterium]